MDSVKEKLVELLRPWLSHLSLAAANDLIAHGVTVQDGEDNNVPTKWISVKDRLPEDSTTVNLYTRSRIVGTGFYDKHTKTWVQYYSGGAILVEATRWMPLPQPPKGERE